MSLKERLDKFFDVKSYGYVVNKWFLRTAFIIMILMFLIVVRVDGWDTAIHGSSFVYCDDPFGCINPFTMDCDSEPTIDGLMYNNFVDCEYETMSYGDSFGFRTSRLAGLFPYLCVGLFALALLLNHLMYNKGFWSVKKFGK